MERQCTSGKSVNSLCSLTLAGLCETIQVSVKEDSGVYMLCKVAKVRR